MFCKKGDAYRCAEVIINRMPQMRIGINITPPYFYLFAGVAFKFLKGKGLNLSRAIYPYFLGQLLLLPVILLQRHLNLAMQTVICRPKRKDHTS